MPSPLNVRKRTCHWSVFSLKWVVRAFGLAVWGKVSRIDEHVKIL